MGLFAHFPLPTPSRPLPHLPFCAPQAQLELDTVVVDEAGCVLEMAVPMLLRLHPSNLVLVGDHLQLQAYTDLKAPPANHCR